MTLRGAGRAMMAAAMVGLAVAASAVATAAPTAAPAAAAPAAPAAAAPAAPAVPGSAAATPPANLLSGEPVHGAAMDPVFAHLKLERLSCKFSEQKRIALLARPLQSTGTIYYDRERGIARATLTPRPQQVVLTRTALHIRTGDRTEDIPLDKTRDLKAFALIFPTLLRGERAELERAFDIALYGSDAGWWALAFAPRTDSLRALVRRVVVFGRKAELVALQVAEASGDTTETQLSEIRTDRAVSDAEIAAAFGAP